MLQLFLGLVGHFHPGDLVTNPFCPDERREVDLHSSESDLWIGVSDSARRGGVQVSQTIWGE